MNGYLIKYCDQNIPHYDVENSFADKPHLFGPYRTEIDAKHRLIALKKKYFFVDDSDWNILSYNVEILSNGNIQLCHNGQYPALVFPSFVDVDSTGDADSDTYFLCWCSQ